MRLAERRGDKRRTRPIDFFARLQIEQNTRDEWF